MVRKLTEDREFWTSNWKLADGRDYFLRQQKNPEQRCPTY